MRELLYAGRALRKSRGFTAVAVLSLGLALGLNTTMFGVVDAVLNPAVPYADPDALQHVIVQGGNTRLLPPGYERYTLLRDRATFHRGLAALSRFTALAQVERSSRPIIAARVSRTFFTVLGVRPTVGRAIDQSSDERIAVVSNRLWQQFLQARRSLDSVTILLDGVGYTVVGVAPRGLDVPSECDVWIPLPATDGAAVVVAPNATIVARLPHGALPADVRPELKTFAQRLEAEYGTGPKPLEVKLESVRPTAFRYENFHHALIGAALAVLLIAGANLSNLLLARAMSQRRDLLVRATLGATRWRLLKQVAAEGVWIAGGGCLLGTMLALWGIGLVTRTVPPELRGIGFIEPQLSWRVFVFGVIAAIVTVLCASLVPAIRATTSDPSEALKDGSGTTTGRNRRYSVLVMAEVALAVALLTGAGLLVKTARRIAQFDFGYDGRKVVAGTISLARPRSAGQLPAPVGLGFPQILSRLEALPGVVSAASHGWGTTDRLTVSMESVVGVRERAIMTYAAVSPRFFETLGVPIIEGRGFSQGDLAGTGAAIVDQAFARRYWPRGDAVGRMVKLGDHLSTRPFIRIVGVVRDFYMTMPADLELDRGGLLFVVDSGDATRAREILVRGRDNPGALAIDVRRELESMVPARGLGPVMPWTVRYEGTLRAHEFAAQLFVLFGGLGVVLAAIGLYGVLSYAVAQRYREFAVRMALGARSADVIRLVLHDGFVMVLAGVGAGAVLAMWSARLIDWWLFGVWWIDAPALIMTELILFAVAFVACYIPARHATKADPLEVLRAA
jgi:predicted permease